MIKYENNSDAQPVKLPRDTTTEDIHRLENLVVVQNQRIEQLDKDVRRLKSELRTAVSAFNQMVRSTNV